MHARRQAKQTGDVNVNQATLLQRGIDGALDATCLLLRWEARPACMQSNGSKADLASTKNNASVL